MLETNNVKQTLAPKELVFKYIRFLPWFAISVVICLVLAFIKLRYSPTIYNVIGKVLVKDQNPYGGNTEKFSDIFTMQGGGDNLADEIEIIKSRNMAARVAKRLNLQTQYSMVGNVRTSLAHPSDMPFLVDIIKVDSTFGMYLNIKMINDDQYTINENTTRYNFNQIVTTPQVTFRLVPVYPEKMLFAKEYIISWQPEVAVASQLSNSINIVRSEGANVLNVSYATDNIRMGQDIVNSYIHEYQQSSLEDKKLIAFSALNFIDEQLDTLQRELGGVERNLQQFRESKGLFNPEEQSSMYFGELRENTKELTSQEVKLRVIDFLLNYLKNAGNVDRIVPSNLMIDEPTLVQQITEFNRLQLEKETLLKTTPAGNMMVTTIQGQIDNLRENIIQNLTNVRTTYELLLKELRRKSNEVNSTIRSIPSKEKQLLEVSRQQGILQELYSFLLQKKLETAISSASTISSIKMLESAKANNIPVSPNKTGLYTLALFLGLAIPAAFIFLSEYLNDKVKNRLDVSKLTSTPILGEVGHADDSTSLVVTSTNRSYIAEQFRILRSNLQFIMPQSEKPVILVTSSFSGEGKSFISTNLGAVLALSGKRTVILEFDIRKPKILKGLGLNQKTGITNFVVGSMKYTDIVYPIPGIENLSVVPCGPVPPNPAEILLDPKITLLFEQLKQDFDAIIVDTAPVGLVSDAISLSQHATAAVYIIRHNYTLKRQVNLIDEIYKQQKLPRLSIVINDIQTTGGYDSYYGYGYGLGKKNLSSDYFEQSKRASSKSWLRRLIGSK